MTQAKINHTPVLIAGAGPTGLVLALWLRKKGIPFRLIDKSPSPGLTSRALAVQARTLEFYRQLGIAEEIIEAGITVRELVMRRLGKVVARAQLGALGKELSAFPYLLFLSQDVHEGILCKILKNLGVEVERQTELAGFSQNESSVTAILNTPKGEEIIRADYICGCDGAHSVVRHGLKDEFPGGRYSQIFFVADVQADGEMVEKNVQISVSPKDFCIVMPIKSLGSTRLTGIVPPESENKHKITYEDVADSVQINTGLKVSKVNWFSTYSVHHRAAEHFQRGRIFLCGDAAHIHSPAGGQGMNTGIGDAINLAWKLADVIQNRFSPKVLESYAVEREAFAKILLKTTDNAFKIIASRSGFGAFARTYLIPTIFAFLTRFRFVLNFMFRTVSQIRIEYSNSPLSLGSTGDIAAGIRLPWIPIGSSDNFEPLKSMNWQVHIYGNLQTPLEDFCKSQNLELNTFSWSPNFESKGFLKDAIYLIRPDGHVAFTSPVQSVDELQLYLQKIS